MLENMAFSSITIKMSFNDPILTFYCINNFQHIKNNKKKILEYVFRRSNCKNPFFRQAK